MKILTRNFSLDCSVFLLLLLNATLTMANTNVWLSSLDLSKMTTGWGSNQEDKSITGQPLSIGGVKYFKGVGTHAQSVMYINLNKGSKTFIAYVGIDDDTENPALQLYLKFTQTVILFTRVA